MVEVLVDGLGPRFNSRSERYVHLLFDNTNTSYAEVHFYLQTLVSSNPMPVDSCSYLTNII